MINYSPLVSIIIPVYNRKDFIIETIKSILSQSYLNWELLIIDDGSTDGTKSILQAYHKEDNRVKYYQLDTELHGAQVCRNKGLEKSKGEFIMFMDSDDLLASFCLEQRVKCIKSKDIEVAVFHQLLFFKKPYDDLTLVNIKTHDDYLSRFLQIVNDTDVPWVNNSVLWKRVSLIDNRILWDINLKRYQDIDFHLNIFWKNLKFKFFETPPDCFWRQHNQVSIGKKPFTKDLFYSNIYFLAKIKNQIHISNSQFDKSFNIKMCLNFYHMIFLPCIKSRYFKLGNSAIRWARKNKFISIADSIFLYVLIILNFIILSDRLKKLVIDNYKSNLLKNFSKKLPGHFKKHQYKTTA